jgi:uncharacterized protein (DUF1778 family)
MKTKTKYTAGIGVRVTADERAAVERACVARGSTLNEWVREAITRHLEDTQPSGDAKLVGDGRARWAQPQRQS